MEHLDVNCYKKIIEYIESRSLNRKSIIISVSQILLKLMKILETKEDREIVKNGIILAISYFTSLPAYEYSNIGEEYNRLPEDKKQIALRNLKNEFLPN